nr:MAG TPA: hypothetical protein [Caudoviricetes sp.]
MRGAAKSFSRLAQDRSPPKFPQKLPKWIVF